MEGNKDNEKKEIFSERVRAGKRTYFFDVKATRSNDYYLTITESKRRFKDDGYTYCPVCNGTKFGPNMNDYADYISLDICKRSRGISVVKFVVVTNRNLTKYIQAYNLLK